MLLSPSPCFLLLCPRGSSFNPFLKKKNFILIVRYYSLFRRELGGRNRVIVSPFFLIILFWDMVGGGGGGLGLDWFGLGRGGGANFFSLQVGFFFDWEGKNRIYTYIITIT